MADNFDDFGISHSDRSAGDKAAIQKLLQRGYSMEAILQLAKDGKLATQANSGARGNEIGGTRTILGGKLLDLIGPAVAPGLSQAFQGALKGPSSRDAGGGQRSRANNGASPRGAVDAIKRAGDAARKYAEIRQGIGMAKSGRTSEKTGPANTSLGPPAAPMLDQFLPETYAPPLLERRDFTGQANDLAAQAYGPMFQAVAQGKQNATGQYNTSDQVVKGLYDRLTQEIQASGAKLQQGYADAGANAGKQYGELSSTIGNNYQAAQDQEAALMQQLGIQAAAPDMIPDDRAFQQAQAAKQGAATQDYYAKQGQAEGDYFSKLGLAGQQEGNVQRQELVQQLSSVLNAYDQQNLQLTGQQSQAAMDIANRLSDQDFQLQQANAGLQSDAYATNAAVQGNAADYAMQMYANQYQQYRDKIGDQQWGQQQNFDREKFDLDASMAIAEAQAGQGGQGLEFNQLPPQQQVVAQADQLAGGQGQQYYEFINSFMSSRNPDLFNLQTFSTAVAQEAAKNGLNPSVAMAIAGSYWNRIMNRS